MEISAGDEEARRPCKEQKRLLTSYALNGLQPGDTFSIHYHSFVPEPITAALGMMSLGALVLTMRRRR